MATTSTAVFFVSVRNAMKECPWVRPTIARRKRGGAVCADAVTAPARQSNAVVRQRAQFVVRQLQAARSLMTSIMGTVCIDARPGAGGQHPSLLGRRRLLGGFRTADARPPCAGLQCQTKKGIVRWYPACIRDRSLPQVRHRRDRPEHDHAQ